MKKVKLIIVLTLITFISAAQNFYYYKGEKIPLSISNKKIIVKFSEGLTFEQKKQITASELSLKPLDKRKTEALPNMAIVDVAKGTTPTQIKETLARLNKNKNVVVANPVFTYKDSTQQGLTDQFTVKLKSPADYSELQRLSKEMNIKILKQNQFEPSIYILQAEKNSRGNALEMANYFSETPIFEFAEPDFLRINIIKTNDPLFPNQWSLKNTGQNGGTSGADIKVEQAWNITTGRSVVKIAVVDVGVDLNHPDLIDNLLPGYDATGNSSNGAPSGNDAHGTACAGIIAAKANNGIGIAGIAYNCKIIPVRAGINNSLQDSWIADGINWAWQNDADVLSNSYGGGSPSSQVDNAIYNAVTQGRGGLGSVLLFASGNDNNSSVNYPSSNNYVLSIGATTKNDVRTSYSNYGSQLAVVAPGGDQDITTTDISGSAGYSSDNYTSSFDGTSAATPHAAGTMALILSVNRCLTYAQAQLILELSCDKVSSLCYNPGKPAGLWNNQYGYGRINAYKAVQYAFSLQTNLFFNAGGNDQGASNNLTWILASGGCSGLAAATYIVQRHEIRTTVTYPYTQAPILLGSANGFSAANPSVGNYYMDVVSVSPTSATVRTWVYDVQSTISGQPLSWVPTDPSSVRFNFTVLSSLDMDLYFQNQNVTGTETHNAMNKIEAGRNVTNAVPVGEYVVKSGANVTFHAGHEIILSDGFVAESGSNFGAYADPFFTCNQYPYGKTANSNGDGNSDFPPVIQEYASSKVTDTAQVKYSLTNYPNPFSTSTNIEYKVLESQSVTITLTDLCGRVIAVFKNTNKQEAGTYKIELDGINLPSGTYLYSIEADNYFETKKMTKAE